MLGIGAAHLPQGHIDKELAWAKENVKRSSDSEACNFDPTQIPIYGVAIPDLTCPTKGYCWYF